MALTNKLSAIGDAIREKTGKTDLMTLDEMPAEIASITTGGGEVEPIVLTGDCEYACSGNLAAAYIDNFGDTVSTKDISHFDYMFYKYSGESIPFDINIKWDGYNSQDAREMFCGCLNLKELPRLVGTIYPNSVNYIFGNCRKIRYIPEDYFDNWNFSYLQSNSSANFGCVFSGCFSLRKIPKRMLNNMWGIHTSTTYTSYREMFKDCFCLDEAIGVGVNQATKLTSNLFSFGPFNGAYRLKNFTFDVNEDSTPKTANWKNQTIDLTKVGCYGYNVGRPSAEWDSVISNFDTDKKPYIARSIIDYNSGITIDKMIYNERTYQALKNDDDAFCCYDEYKDQPVYSRYTRASARATINSLPDCSAFIASNGGTNTIKFTSRMGEATDEGAIGLLTEEEIAVATVKGWTVSLV